jgi:RNA polymerase sigma-70 factor (ECF subfamily)
MSATSKATTSPFAASARADTGDDPGALERCMERFLDGDARAFEDLFERLAPRLERGLRLLTGDRHLAEDLTQTTFLKVLRARDTYQRGMAVQTWVWAIARNAYLDDRRRRARAPEVLVAEPDPPPGDEVATRAPDDDLERALAALPPAQREAIVLLKVQGLSADEAAAAAGTTAGAVKMRAQRAYETLRRILSPSRER